jgi:hypothetical protein
MEPLSVPGSPDMLLQYKCRYGNSLKIIAQGETLIADEFSSSNPNNDWKKYQKDGKELLYCIIEDMTSDQVVCASRAIIDFPCVKNSKNSKAAKVNICDRKRIILDYIHTTESCRGQGLAAELIRFLQRIAKAEGTDFYILAIEDSQVYFLSKFDMILEQDVDLREQYNCFSDTFLLKSPDNVTGSTDMNLHASFINDEVEDEEVDPTSVEYESEEENDLEEAIKASLHSIQNQNIGIPIQAHSSSSRLSCEDQPYNEQLEYAIRLSLQDKLHEDVDSAKSISPNIADKRSDRTSNNSAEKSENAQQCPTSLSEEEMVNQAIALSLSTIKTDNKSQADNVEKSSENKR